MKTKADSPNRAYFTVNIYCNSYHRTYQITWTCLLLLNWNTFLLRFYYNNIIIKCPEVGLHFKNKTLITKKKRKWIRCTGDYVMILFHNVFVRLFLEKPFAHNIIRPTGTPHDGSVFFFFLYTMFASSWRT